MRRREKSRAASSDVKTLIKGAFAPLISMVYPLFAHSGTLLSLAGFNRILVAGIGLEYLLYDVTTYSTSVMAGDVAVIALLEVDAQLAGNLILHVFEGSSASAIACH